MIKLDPPKILIREPRPDIKAAFAALCNPTEYIEINEGIATQIPVCDAVIIPTNLHGFLDRGLALKASVRFGWDVQSRLEHRAISKEGYVLKPWSSQIIPTGSREIQFVICVPTEEHPEPVRLGVASAMRAYLTHNMFGKHSKIRSIGMTPSGFAVHSMHAEDIAQQTVQAVLDFLELSQ
jgi:O-acetyl-ADP-ribose deacetylase (regulator of RNase III)